MNKIIDLVNGIIWSRALIYLCLGTGLYFSIRTRFVQIRGFADMIRLMFAAEKSAAGVSSFQALAMSLSGRVGIGNIAGVATAITFGGPGAVTTSNGPWDRSGMRGYLHLLRSSLPAFCYRARRRTVLQRACMTPGGFPLRSLRL